MSKRPSPNQSNTIDKYYGPTRPKRANIDEASESSVSRSDETVSEEARQAGQAAEGAVCLAQNRIERTGGSRRDSPRPGPSTAPDTSSLESICCVKLMYRPDLDPLYGGDSSSVCSSDPPSREVGGPSVESIMVDESSYPSSSEDEVIRMSTRSVESMMASESTIIVVPTPDVSSSTSTSELDSDLSVDSTGRKM
ncbi:hypothetical protein NQ314_009181 [Rhamnusium bicolor]|uniref:Uncharacterized protein n=1 Tax=Rhamnusium bicolor TaxID=1586634 RepID=A0AAV8Y2G1_9CUCU|nr:hypothetical protein NQ314_009181 [Rhamnusium bicolor]